MNWRVTVVITGLLLASLVASAESVFEAPVQQHPERLSQLESLADSLRQAIPLEGTFEQQKHLAILSQPLQSGGQFALAASGDFRWQVTSPYAIGYHQKAGDLIREIDGEQETVNPAQEPALYGFFQFFSRIFELDYPTLAELFDVYFSGEAQESWQMGLVPKDRRLGRAIARLLITGEGGRIDQVRLFEAGEDTTDLFFSYPDSSSNSPSKHQSGEPAAP